MSVTMFAGALIGTLVAIAAQQRRLPLCRYLLEKRPELGKLVCTTVVFAFVLIPALVLSGEVDLSTSEFFWGGCFVYSFVVSFTLSELTIHPRVYKPHKLHTR